jgi:acyl-homoserine-lactone acylase
VLFGNPHWYWGGPHRFYQAHLTIPGQLNVAGASLLGAPVIMIGFNDQVAWSHTVSTARRYGLFELNLSKDNPTAYHHDGKSMPMTRKIVEVQVREENGDIATVAHTLYRSEHGPVIDFGAGSADLGWGAERALAIRDVNADNFRIFETFLRWNRAQSLDEFVAIQRDTTATPWVNTAAIGRDNGQVWFADIGRVPYVTNGLRQNCTGGLAAIFSKFDPVAPLLDGSRSECNWLDSGATAKSGAMPAERMPSLFSENYVANMNDSYWLTQPTAPIEGLDMILGGEGKPLSLRG